MTTLQELRAFRAVMEVGSMAEASSRIGRTQPQLSRLIKQLEESVGFSLFVREHRRLTATERAHRFYQEVVRVLDGLDNIRRVGEELRQEEGAQLRILAPPYVSYTVVPEAISRYRESYPNGRFSIELVTRSQIGQWISFYSFDIGIASLPFDAPSISVSPLAQVPTVVVMPPGHPLCKCDLIDVTMLAGYDFIALNSFTLVRRQLDHVLNQAGVTLKIIGETDTGLNVCQLVARGLGITIVDRLWVDAMPPGTVEFRPWTPGVTSAFGLIRPNSAAATAPTLLMTSILKDIFRERYNA